MSSLRTALTTVAAGSLALLFIAPAAQASVTCDNAAVWVNIVSEGNEMRKYSPQGVLLDSFFVDPAFGDMALNADATVAYGSDSNGITTYNTTTGLIVGSANALENPLDDEFLWALSGMPNGKLLASGDPDGSQIWEIDPADWTVSLKGDLDDADSSLPIADQGGAWAAAGDYVMAPDGDLIAFANNINFSGTFVVRINTADYTDMTAVGRIPEAWGGARVGDNIYASLADGRIIRVNAFPTSASTSELAYDLVVDTGLDEGVWGAAGTQDQYVGASGCTFGALAETGTDASTLSIFGVALAAAGALAVATRRRRSAK